ncbi:glycosyltransferase family 4 protein [uncultured Winogradskyella sp.]|uniref:glycosyltransferase family 4 protein n=1 Tax=uncultured Winogradskyella sp. TaxID=395353 RepID=UPI0030EC3082|tara:strand:- start:7384 stop:8571 length:1188 start_codon:yes stop_codon:yes gene_type:complete
MIITWIIPDTYGFLVDELEELTTRNVTLRVLTGKPIPEKVKERLPSVSFFYCSERSLILDSVFSKVFGSLWSTYKWRLPRYSYHTKPIAGVYKVLLELEKEQSSDVIHTHFAYPGGIGGTLVNTVPQILTLRGYDILTTGKYGSLWNYFFRNNIINSYAKSGIVNGGSRFTVSRARQILGAEADIRWVSEGLSATTFDVAGVHTRKSLGIKEKDTVLLSIGNLVDVKNHELLLNVFTSLPIEVKENLKLIICGDGPLRGSLEKQCKLLGIEKSVIFMGRLKRAELSDIFELSNIFVHTSMSEGFGNVILEAMLFKLLVVASPVGVAADIIRHKENGLIPELADKASWIANIKEAVSERRKYKEVLEENRNLVLKEYGMDKRIDAYLNLYKEAIEI